MARLKLPIIEQKPKTVIIGATWRDPAGLSNDPAHAQKLLHIRKCIENGAPLPSTYYSKAAGTRPDALLQTYGIMHLHLGKWNTAELLWLVQYPDKVVWLELSDHQPFMAKPPGAFLYKRHKATIQKADPPAPAAPAPIPKPASTGSLRPRLTGKIKLKPKPGSQDPKS